jgi:hypothetical protein
VPSAPNQFSEPSPSPTFLGTGWFDPPASSLALLDSQGPADAVLPDRRKADDPGRKLRRLGQRKLPAALIVAYIVSDKTTAATAY